MIEKRQDVLCLEAKASPNDAPIEIRPSRCRGRSIHACFQYIHRRRKKSSGYSDFDWGKRAIRLPTKVHGYWFGTVMVELKCYGAALKEGV